MATSIRWIKPSFLELTKVNSCRGSHAESQYCSASRMVYCEQRMNARVRAEMRPSRPSCQRTGGRPFWMPRRFPRRLEALAFQRRRQLRVRSGATIAVLCLRMTGNVSESEDKTQDTFRQLYRDIASFRGDSAFSSWLHRVAVNVVLMHFRKKKHKYPQMSCTSCSR